MGFRLQLMNRFLSSLLKPRIFLGSVMLLIVVAVLVWLAVMGKLEPWAAYLDSDDMSLELGGNRYSVYWLIKAILIIIGLLWFTGVASHLAQRRVDAMQRLRLANRALLAKVIQVVIYTVAFLIAIHALGINIAALAVLGGTIGIGIGFGLQKITSNFISGVILLLEKSLESGDLIELSNGALGYVRQTFARYTLIETLDGKEVMVPNEEFIINQVTNLSYSDNKARVEVRVGISYDSNSELARDMMLDTARNHPRSHDDPPPACYLTEFADSSVNLVLYFWIGDVTHDRLGPKSDVMRQIRKRFQESGITIPFPQRDIHIIEAQPPAAPAAPAGQTD